MVGSEVMGGVRGGVMGGVMGGIRSEVMGGIRLRLRFRDGVSIGVKVEG